MSTLAAAALASLAIVAADPAPLKAAPNNAAAVHARLTPGDLLEIRGTRLDHLQVYDHRRERAGFVKASQVRAISLEASAAPQHLAVVRFLRESPGMESLGIAYVAAYLRAMPAGGIDGEAFDALGVMAERLAERASRPGAPASVAAQIDAVGAYGVAFVSYAQPQRMQLCYDGEGFRQVLASARATPEQQARAVLALTRPECSDPDRPLSERAAMQRRHAEMLDSLRPAALAALDEGFRNRLRMRRAGLWAAIVFADAQAGEETRSAGQRALSELAGVQKEALNDDDQAVYAEAAMRVGAARWSAEAVPAVEGPRLRLRLRNGDPGQRCVQLFDTAQQGQPTLAERCTYGVVWPASARASADNAALALQVQQTPTWTELWLWRRGAQGWVVEVLPPAALTPEIGYAEFAGWAPGQAGKLLVAREAKAEGRMVRRFEVMALDSLSVEKSAGTPELLSAFGRWADARWRRGTVSLR